MSGFTTWLNSPSIGHSLSGTEDSQYNVCQKVGDEHQIYIPHIVILKVKGVIAMDL